MRRLPVALLVVTTVAMAAHSSRQTAAAPDTSHEFRVATYNIHKGANLRGRYDLDRTIEAIQRLDADAVGVEEALRNDPGFHCDDQPALIAAGLRRRTGRPWTYTYAKAWITDNRQCLERGGGDDVATEGLAIFTRDRIVGSQSVRLATGRIGLAVHLASMPHVPIIVTHLEAARSKPEERARELGVLLPWAARQGPGVLVGDFNAPPDAMELGTVMESYHDAWAEAAAMGRTGGITTGSTRPGRRISRIDYVFFTPGLELTLESVDIVATVTPPWLHEPSDHHPVVATFRRDSLAHPGQARDQD